MDNVTTLIMDGQRMEFVSNTLDETVTLLTNAARCTEFVRIGDGFLNPTKIILIVSNDNIPNRRIRTLEPASVPVLVF